MEDTRKIMLFEQVPVPRAVAQLAVPTILSSLVMVLYNLADTYFVGMLGNPVENAAVTLAAPVLLAFNAVNNLFGVGSSSMMSRAMGRKEACTIFQAPLLTLLGSDSQTASSTAGYLKWTVCFGAAPAILNVVMAYLVRSEGAALHASVGTMSGCILNVILDPFFIMPWGLNMGAEGAGLATFLSNCVACLYFFVLLFFRRKTTCVRLLPRRSCFRKKIVLGVFGVGIPASIQNLLNVTGMTILNNFTSAYGPDAVAAMGITQKINQVPTQISLGLSQGLMPLVSYNYASGNFDRMKKAFLFAFKIVLVGMTAICTFYFFQSEFMIRLFMDNDVIIGYGSRFLHGFCLGLPFLCMDFLCVGVFQATGMGRFSLLFAIMRKILLEIPALFILNALFPLYGLAYAQLTAEVVLSAAGMFVLYRLFGRRKSS